MGQMRHDYGKWADEAHAMAISRLSQHRNHPAEKHYRDAIKHFNNTKGAIRHGDDDEIVRHFDRGVRSLERGNKMAGIKEEEKNPEIDQEIDEAVVSRAVLHKYMARRHAKARSDVNNKLDNLDADKADLYAELSKQRTELNKIRKAGDAAGAKKLKHAMMATISKNKLDHARVFHEDLGIIDRIMTSDEIEYSPYRVEFEGRLNAMADTKKEELKASLFDFTEGHSINQLRQAQFQHAHEKGYHERIGNKRKAAQHLKAERTARELRWKKEDENYAKSKDKK